MKIPVALRHRVKEAYKDEDGFWIVLAKEWRCPDGYFGDKTIHEDNYKDAIQILRKTRFTLK